MATVNILSTGKGGAGALASTLKYCMNEEKTVVDGTKYVTGLNCVPESSYTDMMCTKNEYDKTDGRMYYHLDQSFSPNEKITPDLAHKVAVEFAEKAFPGYEVVIGTHCDTDHIHSHFVVNSVSFETGLKYHSDKNNIERLREISDEVCKKHGLSIVENPKEKSEIEKINSREYRSAMKFESWKFKLAAEINIAMKCSRTKDEFISNMEAKGYGVRWSDTRKSITYTTPEGYKCRDNKLHGEKYLKEVMVREFAIRNRITKFNETNRTKDTTSRESNDLRSYHGSQLEESYRSNKREYRGYFDSEESVGRVGDQVRVGRLNESGSSSYSGVRVSNGAGREGFDFGFEGGVEEYDSGIPETGWEESRAICFGYAEDSGNVSTSDTEVYEEDISYGDSSDFGLVDGIELGLDILSLIGGGTTKDEEKKTYVVHETKDDHNRGPVMSM
ncbi:MAG: relaxase/mobilization nuclease domain-containing protein [Saccharofermentans sp.]|nr:relaxase/mobilization nuclease domain-containing protein [Saccharofermentans sp.]